MTYGYNSNHQITSVTVNSTTVLSSATYEPLGPVNGWTWGNSTSTARTYDTDQKIAAISSAGTKTLSYDNAFRITGISDSESGASNWTYGYDALDRITSASDTAITRGWTYDANGNRLTETGTSPSTYSISSSNNQISSITGTLARTYSYDAAGHTTGYSSISATYNDAGRLKALTNGTVTETLIYNALGQRIETSGGASGTILYWYDEAGHLLGEYDGSGNLIEETVWLGDTPVATLRPSGSSVAIYYVHTDQLNTPRQVTRPSDNSQMWSWFSDPFGTDAANSNPAGNGAFAYNLRLPGQAFDGQAGLHANYFRDYDPAIGRYLESDPIGLHRGSYAIYAYVNANPIGNQDPLGLWSVTGGGYVGVGTEITIGYDNGHWFFTDRFGFGIGGGFQWDPHGGVPGGTDSTGCKGGVVLSVSGKADAGFGPFGAGIEGGAFRNYGSLISDFFGSVAGLGDWNNGGLHAGASFGGQVTLYTGVH